jgi:hypothetical protein
LYQIVDLSFTIPAIAATLILVLAEIPLLSMKKYMRAGKAGTPPSGIVSRFRKSYDTHSRSWNMAWYLLWALGASILGLWLQDIWCDEGLIIALLLMWFRFSDFKTISEEAGIAVKKEE